MALACQVIRKIVQHEVELFNVYLFLLCDISWFRSTLHVKIMKSKIHVKATTLIIIFMLDYNYIMASRGVDCNLLWSGIVN